MWVGWSIGEKETSVILLKIKNPEPVYYKIKYLVIVNKELPHP